MRSMLAVLALAFGCAGCAGAPGQELLSVASTDSARSGALTTRDVCTACGCVANESACDCSASSLQSALDCLDRGGPVESEASPPGRRVASPGSPQPLLMNPNPPPTCGVGQVLYCTTYPLHACWCVDIVKK